MPHRKVYIYLVVDVCPQWNDIRRVVAVFATHTQARKFIVAEQTRDACYCQDYVVWIKRLRGAVAVQHSTH